MNDDRRKRIAKVRDALAVARAELEVIRDEEQDAFDNSPESIKDGERGEKMTAAIDGMTEVVDELEAHDEKLEEASQ